MKLSKFDIGAEIISIITRGMYPDPKDALREYIQNGVDAEATKISVKIRQESIVVEDDGIGMNHKKLRDAVRVGVSDKNPSNNVGFMGIGIYSSFHLCNKLTIYSQGSENIPNKLVIDFGKMKNILESQKEKRLAGDTNTDEHLDLQSLLETCIDLSDNELLKIDDFPKKGTRVELSIIEPEFYAALSDFDEVASYLRNVIPLRFNADEFKYAEEIEQEIVKICQSKSQKFEIIDLTLQVNSKISKLYRPYRDRDFSKDGPQSPKFYTIESGKEFLGVAWGCLNTARKKVEVKTLRGFLIRKQGFSIGNREVVVKYFPRGNTYFDRFSGEIIIINPKLLPNASRNEIEYSPLRSVFYNALSKIASEFDNYANEYQEFNKAEEELGKLQLDLQLELGSYNEYEEDAEILINKIVAIRSVIEEIDSRIARKGFSQKSKIKALKVLSEAKDFEKNIQNRLKTLTRAKNKKATKVSKTRLEIANNLNQLSPPVLSNNSNYENLVDMLDDIDIKISPELKVILDIIDEIFIQGIAKSKANYYETLNHLKNTIQNN